MSKMIEVIRDGEWHLAESPVVSFDQDEMPVDEWYCATCGYGVGYQLGPQDVPNLGWTEVWVAEGDDPMSALTKKYCADCAGEMRDDD